MENIQDIMQQKYYEELSFEFRPQPQVALPRHWFGPKKKPENSTPAAWRETFELERDLATTPLDRINFGRLVKLTEIAESCGATHLSFKTSGYNKDKYLQLIGIYFPDSLQSAMMHEFQSRLSEIK